MDNIKFSQEYVYQYVVRRGVHNRKYRATSQNYNYNFSTDAMLALFDKNADAYISKKEFNQISKKQYDSYVTDLKAYNKSQFVDDRIPDYETFATFVEKGSLMGEEISLNIHEPYEFNIRNHPELKNLKDTTQMSEEEVKKEFESYGIDITTGEEYQSLNLIKLRFQLKRLRKEIVFYDSDSNKVDWKIGSYSQGDHGLCRFLSLIAFYPEEKLKNLYKEKTDEQGKKYYEIQFPIDKENGKTVIITEEELKNGEITFKNPNSNKEESLAIFSKGDNDITLLEMAFLKRFGDDYFKNGTTFPTIENIMKIPEKEDYVEKHSLTQKEFTTLKAGDMIYSVSEEYLRAKKLPRRFDLSDGRNVAFDIFGNTEISDGTRIPGEHAMAVKGYDPKTKELIIVGSQLTNASELRIPLELSEYFSATCRIDLK